MDSKKFSTSEFPTDAEIDEAKKKSVGVCGLEPKTWGQLLGALLCLYIVLAFLFWGLLEAALEVRSEDWLELPNRFFGSFSKVERQLMDLSGNEVFVTNDELDFRRVEPHLVNYPDGCEVSPDNADLLQCGAEGSGKTPEKLWSIFPWISANNPVADCVGQTFTTILNQEGQLAFGAGGELAEGVCINSVAKA